MEHEVGVCLLAVDIVEKLLVIYCSKCCYSQGLCFTTCKECTSMCAGENTHFTCNRSDFSDLSSVGSDTVIENRSTKNVVLHIVKHLHNKVISLWLCINYFTEFLDYILVDLI